MIPPMGPRDFSQCRNRDTELLRARCDAKAPLSSNVSFILQRAQRRKDCGDGHERKGVMGMLHIRNQKAKGNQCSDADLTGNSFACAMIECRVLQDWT